MNEISIRSIFPIILVLIITLQISVSGQYSIHSSGETVQSSEYTLTFTTGELLNLSHNGNFYQLKNGVIQYESMNISSASDIPDIDIHIYPNPVEDRLTIITPVTARIQYQIYDLRGRLVMKGNLDERTVPVSELLPAGYIIKMNFEDYTFSKLFIKT